jgi:2,3-dihydroxybenzoate-AMP ligase
MLDGVTPYPPEFIARYRQKGYWEDRTIGQFFEAVCRDFADNVAIVAGDTKISYRQMHEKVARLASHLLKLGLQPQDRLVLQLPNVPEFIYLYFALQKIGVIPVMALATHRYAEISHFIKLSEAVGYAIPLRLGDFDFRELAAKLSAENEGLRFVLVNGETNLANGLNLAALLETDISLAESLSKIKIDPLFPALFQLSGGTTGVPKLIPRTHNDYLYNTKASAAINAISPESKLLIVLPMSHNFQGFFRHGARVVLLTSTKNEDIFATIEREKITHLELVPTLLIRLVNDPNLSNYDLTSLKIINSGGQKLQTEVKILTEKLLPHCVVQEVFGMAEGLLCYGRLDDSTEVRYETVGRPVSPDDELRLVDDAGNEVPDGEIGELLVRGPYTLRGYYRAPEHNSRVFTADGFYRSGDLMRRHPSGNYIVEGRKKDLINRGGEKISAEEIENLILAHPAVLNVACVPIPDPVLGERVCACVVLHEGANLNLKELADFLLGRGIAKFKLPERLEVLAELPLSKFGKVAKNVLTQQLKVPNDE